jgi:hypothetical protein
MIVPALRSAALSMICQVAYHPHFTIGKPCELPCGAEHALGNL